MPGAPATSKSMILLAFIAIYVVGGTLFLAIAEGIKTVPPFILEALRFSFPGIALLVYCGLSGEAIFVPEIGRYFVLGTVVLTISHGLIYWAEQYISSGFSAILASTVPVWLIVMDNREWRNHFRNKFMLTGVALGLIGVFFLLGHQSVRPSIAAGNLKNFAPVAVILSGICYAGGSLYNKNNPVKGSIHLKVGWQLTGATVSSIPLIYFSGEFDQFHFRTVSHQSWFAVFYLGVAGSLVAFFAYNWLLTIVPAPVVGTYAYVNPVIALVLGWQFAGEQVSFYQVGGMVIILVSAFLVNFPDKLKFKHES